MAMPKAEFDTVLQVRDGLASVSGPLSPDERGPRASLPVRVHWVLVQGDQVSTGIGDMRPNGTWGSQDAEAHVWTAGTAHAAGVIFNIRAEPTDADPAAAVVETFTWSQRVTLSLA
jgi:hypothetical protein